MRRDDRGQRRSIQPRRQLAESFPEPVAASFILAQIVPRLQVVEQVEQAAARYAGAGHQRREGRGHLGLGHEFEEIERAVRRLDGGFCFKFHIQN